MIKAEPRRTPKIVQSRGRHQSICRQPSVIFVSKKLHPHSCRSKFMVVDLSTVKLKLQVPLMSQLEWQLKALFSHLGLQKRLCLKASIDWDKKKINNRTRLLGFTRTGRVEWRTSLYRRNGLQLCLEALAPQPLEARNSLVVMRKRLKEHCRCFDTSHLPLMPFLSFLDSSLFDETASFVDDEARARYARHRSEVASKLDFLKLASHSILEW